ncbi:MAG: hypothetical protein J6Y04_10530 [Bacteroidaceae bacterium]|nr:hypothetical protein [Bacteroidaceae bacterium]
MKHNLITFILMPLICCISLTVRSQIISVPQVPFTPATFTPSNFTSTPYAPPIAILMTNKNHDDGKTYPTYDVKIERKVQIAHIETEAHSNVIVEIKAAGILDGGVKITIKDYETGKKIYKKRFSHSYLYCYPDGDIMVGKGDALKQVIILKDNDNGIWLANIKAGGIY